MPAKTVAPYGEWPSPLTAEMLASASVRRIEPRVLSDGSEVGWLELRPSARGRTAIVKRQLKDFAATERQTQTPGGAAANAPSEGAYGTTTDVPGTLEADIRNRVHSYGGGSWIEVPPEKPGATGAGRILASSGTDGRVWLFDGSNEPRPITPEPAFPNAVRFADGAVLPGSTSSVWVRETHAEPEGTPGAPEPVNDLVEVSLDGTVQVVASGADFYGRPQPNPDGTHVAFISWDHPNMPWDHTRLCLAERNADGWRHEVLVDGPALQQPVWSPEGPTRGQLFVISDHNGWWEVCRVEALPSAPQPSDDLPPASEPPNGHQNHELLTPVLPAVASEGKEFGAPAWSMATTTYCFAQGGSAPSGLTIWCNYMKNGVGYLGLIHLGDRPDGAADGFKNQARLTTVNCGSASPYTSFTGLSAAPDGGVVTVAASWTEPPAVVHIAPVPPDELRTPPADAPSSESTTAPAATSRLLSPAMSAPLPLESISVPSSFTYPISDDPDALSRHFHHGSRDRPAGTWISLESDLPPIAQAFYFPPASATHTAPDGERHPLLVISHGGPTGCARSSFDAAIQFFTSRGIGVVDVNYRGSTGFGTDYRRALDGNWGVTDVEDCLGALRWLDAPFEPTSATGAQLPNHDSTRITIKGGSASGYTTLSALCDSDAFAAGISRYGVADLFRLATDTHKFEARYLDRLLGELPAAEATYAARSPLNRADQLRTPMLFLQGTDDPVVPQEQSDRMVAALETAAVPYAYVLFEGEQHGFRDATNIIAAQQAELAFLGEMLGFTPADELPPLTVHRPAQG